MYIFRLLITLYHITYTLSNTNGAVEPYFNVFVSGQCVPVSMCYKTILFLFKAILPLDKLKKVLWYLI